MRSEKGFTVIELITVAAIIGVLAALALTGVSLYRANAAYAAATVTLRNARNAVEASTSDQDILPPAVPPGAQLGPGPIADPVAERIFPGLQLGPEVKLSFGYDPTCKDAACPYETYLQANHCKGTEYMRWIRFGDGVEVTLEHIAGGGCA